MSNKAALFCSMIKDNLKIFIGGFVVVVFVIVFGIYSYYLGPVSKDTGMKEIEVPSGYSYLTLGNLLKENKLIKSDLFYKIYIKLNNPNPLEACTYQLSESMGVKEIVEVLSEGCQQDPDAIRITFNEGITMRKIAKLIAENTNNSEDDVFELQKDESYIDSLIEKYWFLTDEIKNKEIYYPLEGYLFPDTYEFYKDTTVEKIFEVMLDEMDKNLAPYKEEIKKKNFTIHEFLTFASIIEAEAASDEDRATAAGVFYNRLKDNWSLGSCVTTYYASQVDMGERDLYESELNDYNAYNTRNVNLKGLPVGPIGNPGLASIEASLNPKEHDYYYFLSDKNGELYFYNTEQEHQKMKEELQKKGLWLWYYD